VATKGKTGAKVTQKKTGRPSKYSPEFHPLLAEALAKTGATDKQICEKLGIAEPTLYAWKKEHPEFSKALKDGKEEPDEKVRTSLYSRAVGYDNPNAVKIFMPANAKEPVYAPYTEHHAPDVTACIFWLKNRRPDEWREKQEITLETKQIIVKPAPTPEE
jgi:transposase-like protein